MIRLDRSTCRLALGILLVGCAGGRVPAGGGPGGLLIPASPGGLPGAESAAVAGSAAPGTALAGSSTLVVTIRWPQRSIQLLPDSTSKVDLVVKDPSGGTLGAASVARAGGASSATAAFERLPSGSVTLTATAKNASGATVATGSTTVTLVPNRRNLAALTLAPSNPPAIAAFSPKAGGPGTQVSVTGTNFPSGQNQIAVALGGVDVAALQIAPFGPAEFAFFVPSGATTSAIAIVIDGIKASSAALFTTVGSVSVSPADPQTGASGSPQVFTVTALDTATPGQAVEGAPVTWTLTNVTGVNPPAGGGGGVDTTPPPSRCRQRHARDLLDGAGDDRRAREGHDLVHPQATGSAWVNVSAGTSLKATVSITIQ